MLKRCKLYFYSIAVPWQFKLITRLHINSLHAHHSIIFTELNIDILRIWNTTTTEYRIQQGKHTYILFILSW